MLKPGLQESEAEQGWEAKTLWEDPPTGISQSTGDAVRFARTSLRGKADPCGEFIPTPSVQVRIDRPLRVSDLDRLRSEVNARLGYRSRGAQERRCLKHIVEQELGLEERDSRKGSWQQVNERWVGHGQESKNWQAHMMCYRRLKGIAVAPGPRPRPPTARHSRALSESGVNSGPSKWGLEFQKPRDAKRDASTAIRSPGVGELSGLAIRPGSRGKAPRVCQHRPSSTNGAELPRLGIELHPPGSHSRG